MAKKLKSSKIMGNIYTKKKKASRKTSRKLENKKNNKEYQCSLSKKKNINKGEIVHKDDGNDKNELKIELYPNKKLINNLELESVNELIDQYTIAHSFDINQKLAYLYSKVPVLNGFYTAYTNHYPIRIKPDDIWLLIAQAFSYHVNSNFEELKKYFVNFEGKKDIIIEYKNLNNINQIDKNILEDFSEKINEKLENYLSKEIIDILTPDFTTTTHDSKIICKITIMGIFKKYFNYKMKMAICGIPYIILEGNSDDYKKIKSKAENLSKYEFDWYIKRIIPIIEKMIQAKEGNIDIDFFKNIVQKKEITEDEIHGCGRGRSIKVRNTYIYGWILNFFAKYKKERFNGNSINVEKFEDLAGQMMTVNFEVNEKILMEYSVGFIGCDKNENNEIFPVQGWMVSKIDKNDLL